MNIEARDRLPKALASAVRKSSARLLPLVVMMYALAFVDRANLGFAKIAFQADTGISDAAYGVGAGIFFVGYALFELPSNLLLRLVGARILLSGLMVSWGVVSAAMACATSSTSFYFIRCLLGITEAGFVPGIIFYLTYWFPESERSRALGLFYLGVPIAMLLGSPVSGLLLEASPPLGLRNWQWMFLVEGGASILAGGVAAIFLENRPAGAKWLTPGERAALGATLEAEEARKSPSTVKTVRGALTSKKIRLFILINFCVQIGNAPLAFYLPAKLAASFGGVVDTRVGVLLAIPWLCTMVAMRWATIYADRHGHHRIIVATMLAAGIAAFASLSQLSTPWLTLLAFCIAIPGLVACQPVFWSLPMRHLTGRGAAGGIAFIGSIGNLGGFVSPQLKTLSDKLTGNSSAGFLLVSSASFLSVLLLLVLRDEPENQALPTQ